MAPYHEIAEAGSEVIANLQPGQVEELVNDMNANGGSPNPTVWLQIIGQSEAGAVRRWVMETPFGIRVLSFLGGVLMFISGFVGFFMGLFAWDGDFVIADILIYMFLNVSASCLYSLRAARVTLVLCGSCG